MGLNLESFLNSIEGNSFFAGLFLTVFIYYLLSNPWNFFFKCSFLTKEINIVAQLYFCIQK